MNLYIDQSIFKDLCRLTLSCRRSINPNIYMTFFHSKERMTVVDYFKFRKEIIKELEINKTLKAGNLYDKYNVPSILNLKRVLNIIEE